MRARNDTFIATCGIAVVALLGAAAAWCGWWAAAGIDDAVPTVPAHPIVMVRDLARGRVDWPPAATPWGAACGVLLLTVAVASMVAIGRRRAVRSTSVDELGRQMSRDRGLDRYLSAADGPPIGRVLSGHGPRRELAMTAEDQALVIAGPRVGKTTSLAIPAALTHRGPLVVTSNKRDIYDAVAEERGRQGRVWLFDPQDLTGAGPARWWWNPLATTADVRGARRLASIWRTASRDPNATTDAYFDTAAEELLAELLCAAAHADTRIVAVYDWLNRPDDPTPIEVLRRAAGAEQLAAGLEAASRLPEKQRAGVYGTARTIVAWLADPAIRAWIEPGAGRDEYEPATLATSSDTLVSLSREGQGSAAPLVTALTAAVLDAAEAHAALQRSGRLDPYLLGVLDEACNVCRWRELPDLYSHYGSRGIVLASYAQSWAQLAAAFGEHGAEKLWSSSNVRVYAGGVSDTKFLRRLSELVGDYDETVSAHSTTDHGRGPRARSESVQQRRRPIMEISTLAALPAGRALVFLSAARPVLVEIVPYWQRPRVAAVQR